MAQVCSVLRVSTAWGVLHPQQPADRVLGAEHVLSASLCGPQPNFTSLAYHYHNYFVCNACNILLALMRILSFMRINPNISQLSETFSNSRFAPPPGIQR